MRAMIRLALAGVLALLPLTAPPAVAQDKYPSRPIRIIVPYGPGGTDTTTRSILAEQLRQILGQAIVVENKPGALGIAGMDELVRAKPDGYTVMTGNVSTHGITPVLHKKKLAFDYETRIVPVIRFADTPSMLVATLKDFPPATINDLAEYARARPGAVKYGVIGIGAFSHLDTEIMSLRMGAKLALIPYKASVGEMVKDLINGDIQMAFLNVLNAQAPIKAGQLRPLAMAAPERHHAFPDVPTFAEAGYPNVGSDVWVGLFAPRGTPAEVLETLSTAVHEALRAPMLKDAFANQQIVIKTTANPAAAEAWMKAELAKWTQILQETKIDVE